MKGDDVVVLRKKFEEVDAIVRELETRIEQFRSGFYVDAQLQQQHDPAALLQKVNHYFAEVARIGKSSSLVAPDLAEIQAALGSEYQERIERDHNDVTIMLNSVSAQDEEPTLDEEGVCAVIRIARKLLDILDDELLPYLHLRDALQIELSAAVEALSAKQTRTRRRDVLVKLLRPLHQNLSWRDFAQLVRDDPRAADFKDEVTADTVRQPFRKLKKEGE